MRAASAPPGNCAADLDDSCAVDEQDVLLLLAAWGPCCPFGSASSFESKLAERGIATQDWEEYLDILDSGTPLQVDTWTCWFDHHMSGSCTGIACAIDPCPGTSDPFGIHE